MQGFVTLIPAMAYAFCNLVDVQLVKFVQPAVKNNSWFDPALVDIPFRARIGKFAESHEISRAAVCRADLVLGCDGQQIRYIIIFDKSAAFVI